MTFYVGGLRARLIWDSLFLMLEDSLDQLNWFDIVDSHLPVFLIAEPYDSLTEIKPNTVTIAPEDTSNIDAELGSNFTEKRTTFFVDMFAENDVIGTHLIYDVKDILEGRMASIGRERPSVNVYDYDQATPPVIFTCEIQDVRIDRGKATSESWKSTWYSCSFTIVDYYYGESG